MNRRQKIWTTASLAVATGAILGGVAVTSNAMAASGTPETEAPVTLEMISMGTETGGEAIHCTFTDVPVEVGSVPAIGLPAIEVPEGAVAGGSGIVVSSGVFSGTEVSPDALPAPSDVGAGSVEVVTAIAATAGAAEGLPTPVESVNVREGTEEECAAIRPVAVPAPPAG